MSLSRFLASWLIVSGALFPVSVQAQKPADIPTFPQGTDVVTVPYSKPLDFNALNSLHVRMSINGGPAESFQVDTGSVGIVVGAIAVKNFDASNGTPGELTYSSSGVHESGVWTTVEITFPDAKLPDGSPVVAHVPVLAVTNMDCTGKGVNAARCKPSSSAPNPHMLGIGFGRGGGFGTQLKNAFLQLDAMQQGKMRRGYLISPKGIQLGLNAETVSGAWSWQKLVAREGKAPDNYNGPRDWETAAGTFAVDGKAATMGSVLMDTGLTNMMLETKNAPQDGDVPGGTPVKIYLLGGQLSYDFKVNDSGNAAAPRRTSWRPATHGTFVNTGLHPFTLFDYCYDADGGYLGLRPRK
ncbi:hypothetical protein SAMN05421770_10814 [Granulicella rosea]|uniref:PE cleavage protein A C-terminal domain-containing protein n=1 Tax=Granulicella rosea TaxID=474952 RepID=A0A239LVK8_9BACT|nr:hypothetical protein [Granulicella rosea]SNT34566.1 hypothetical protein SAMN05421770_10814 [Granulicella rosea]